MDAVLKDNLFVDFGQDLLYPFARTGLRRVEGDCPSQLRSAVREYVPRTSGVYGMIDRLGRLVYVGKSKCLRNRLLSYFLPNNEEDKAGRIVQSTCAIVWENQPSEFAALVREQNLIRNFQPRFNVQGIPRRQQPIFICLGRGPAEQLYTARFQDANAVCTIGPLFGAARANRAVEVLNRVFKLRDCSSKQSCGFTDQLQLFDIELRPGCIRLEIDTCLGPCIAACSRKLYADQVAAARSFLQGDSAQPLDTLQRSMKSAASNQHFEQAIVLREDIKAVTWLHRRALDLAQARERYTFVYPVSVENTVSRTESDLPTSRTIWYLIRHGILEGAIAAPKESFAATAEAKTCQLHFGSSSRESQRAQSQLRNWLTDGHHVGSSFVPRPETLALVASWFRKNRGELKKCFLPKLIRGQLRDSALAS